MTLAQFLTKVKYALRGTDADVPTLGDDDADQWVDTLNRKKDELYEDVTKQWSTAYKASSPNETGTVATTGTTTLTGTNTFFTDYDVGDQITVSGETVRTINAITSNTVLTVSVAFSNTATAKTFTRAMIIDSADLTYNLHRSFLSPSDRLFILHTSGAKSYLDVVKPQERDYTNRQVHISGQNPQVLTFTESIVSTESIVGGTLFIPGFYMPDDVAAATDILPLPDPNWGVMSVAAEIAFNDIVYENKEESLNIKANNLYDQMIAKNRRGTYANPGKVPYDMARSRIRSPERI